ncbi:MAG: ComEC/Rec2 family competence protein [Bacteroidales bacterium]
MARIIRQPWDRFPLFKLLLPFMAGITAGVYEFIPFLNSMFLAVFLTVFFLLLAVFRIRSYRFRWLFGVFAMTGMFVLGHCAAGLKLAQNRNSELGESGESHNWLVEAREYPVEKENAYKIRVEVLAKDSTVRAPETAVLYIEKDSMLMASVEYGSRLIVHTKWQRPQEPTNPEQFNYKAYLERTGITHQAYTKAGRVVVLQDQKKPDIREFVLNLRETLLQYLRIHGFSGHEFTLAAAILLGKDDTMDPRLRSGFASAGAMHILCVSGLHVGVIFLILEQLLKFFNRRKYGRKIKAVMLILMIWFYAAVTGLEPSVMRAATMVSFVVVGNIIHRPVSVYNSLAASAFLLLIINPLIITHIGFQLSYMAVLAIVSFQPVLFKLWIPKYILPTKIWAVTTVSIAAQMGTFPLAIHYFHIFPLYFLITNLIVIPLSAFIIYSGFMFFITLPLQPLAWIFAKILFALLWVLKQTVFTIEQWPSASLNFLNLNPKQIILIYLSMVLVFIWVKYANRKALLCAFSFCCLLLLSFFLKYPKRATQQELLFYDAGRGLAVEVVSGTDNVVLMDSTVSMDERFINYSMKENWIRKGLKDPELVCLEKLSRMRKKYMIFEHNTLLWKDTLVYMLRDDHYTLQVPPDLLLVHNHRAVPSVTLKDSMPRKIVLTGNVPPWNRKKWKAFADTNQIPIHDLPKGALRICRNADQ